MNSCHNIARCGGRFSSFRKELGAHVHSALWTWDVLPATYVSLQVFSFSLLEIDVFFTSRSVQSSAFVAPLIVPYQTEIPYSSTGNEPCTTPL